MLFNPRTGSSYSLNEEGIAIWRHLERGSTPEAIAAELAKRYDLPVSDLLEYVDAFLLQLSRNGLVLVRAQR